MFAEKVLVNVMGSVNVKRVANENNVESTSQITKL